MKGDEYRKVSKYKYIYKYFRMKGWKEMSRGKYLSMNISLGTTGIKDERRRVYGKYLSMNISLGTTGLKDEWMKGWKEGIYGK